MKYGLLLLKIALTIGAVWFVWQSFDFKEVTTQLQGADKTLLLIGTLQLALQPILGALRWHVVLKRFGMKILFHTCLRLTYISMFFNQALPASIGGDGIRTWKASRLGYPLGAVVTSVIVDRAAMLCTTLVAAVATSFAIELPGAAHLRTMSGLVLLVAVGGIFVIIMIGQSPAKFLNNRIARLAAQLSFDVRRTVADPRTFIIIFTLCLLSLLNMAIAICLYARAFGDDANSISVGLVVPFVVLASILPISVGGWGTREASMVYLLAPVGISPSSAILTSVMFGVASITVCFPGALIYLAHRKKREGEASLAIPIKEGPQN